MAVGENHLLPTDLDGGVIASWPTETGVAGG